MEPNYPKQFGFITKLEELRGKTIEHIEGGRMPWGCTWDNCILMRFTDGTRAFLVGKSGDLIMGPTLDTINKSRIFTYEEVGKVAEDQARLLRQREAEIRRNKERELERLQRELGT